MILKSSLSFENSFLQKKRWSTSCTSQASSAPPQRWGGLEEEVVYFLHQLGIQCSSLGLGGGGGGLEEEVVHFLHQLGMQCSSLGLGRVRRRSGPLTAPVRQAVLLLRVREGQKKKWSTSSISQASSAPHQGWGGLEEEVVHFLHQLGKQCSSLGFGRVRRRSGPLPPPVRHVVLLLRVGQGQKKKWSTSSISQASSAPHQG